MTMPHIHTSSPRAVFDENFQLGESPVWDVEQQRLAFVDVDSKRVHTFVPVTGEHMSYAMPEPAPGVILSRNPSRLLVAQLHTIVEIDLSDRGAVLRTLARVPPEQGGEKDGWMFNDARAAPSGIIIAGRKAPGWDKGEGGYVHELTAGDLPQLSVALGQGKLGLPNGMAWDMDKQTIYYADTYTCKVHNIPCNAAGVPTNDTNQWRTVTQLNKQQEGMPDGIAIDAAGGLWIAHEHGGQVSCVDVASGKRLHTISMPCRRISAVAFGGSDLRQLYITTIGNGDDSPDAGKLFVVDVSGAQGAAGAHMYG